MLKKSKNILTVFFLFLSILILISLNWFSHKFSLVNLDQIIYSLNAPLEGTNTDIFVTYSKDCIPITIVLTFIFSIIFISNVFKSRTTLNIKFEIFKHSFKWKIPFISFVKHKLLISFILFIISMAYFVQQFSVIDYVKSQIVKTNIYDEYFVDTKNANINFKEKRNLIYIFVESLESSYMDESNGGLLKENFIPNLTTLAKEEINFSDKNDSSGGAYSIPYTTWTSAGMVAQTAGVPLNMPFNNNDANDLSSLLPGAYTIGEVLQKAGYTNELLLGSGATFAGKKTYFKQHGDYKIFDYWYALNNNYIPEGYKEWWGYEDSKLFEFAKSELEELSNQDKPFNLTMLTANTHFDGGYLEKDCPSDHDDYTNALMCSDKYLYNFVRWVQNQDFYEDTSIVITGDHLAMQGSYFPENRNDERRLYNVFINSKLEPASKNNRYFTALDLFPTTLASLGAEIKGDRLGMGTNLFSDQKTIMETKSPNYVIKEINKKSDFYNKNIVYNK